MPRLRPGYLFVLAGLAQPAVPAGAAEVTALVVSTVRPVGTHGCRSMGTGFPVGGGLVLTAAHVLLTNADLAGECRFGPAALRVAQTFSVTVQAGTAAPVAATVVAKGERVADNAGRMSFSGAGDWAILRSAAPLRSEQVEPCTTPPQAGQAVLLLLRSGVVRTQVAWEQTDKGGDDAAYVDLDRVAQNGESGAGILDAARRCVLGLVSHRFPEPRPRVTRMTPVALFADAWRRARGG